MTMLALTLTDLAVVYLLPVAAAAAGFLLGSLSVYLFLLTTRSPLRVDFQRRYEDKKKLPSGERLRFSYPYVAKLLLADNGMQATVLYRMSHFFAVRRLHAVAGAVHSFSKFLTHIDISPYAEIGGGVYFYHGLGTVVGKGSFIGRNALVCQNVTTGGGHVRIGDDVALWAGAKVIGDVTIGDRAEIGANAVVVRDVPADCVAVGVPATRFIPKQPGGDGEGTTEVSMPAPEARLEA